MEEIFSNQCKGKNQSCSSMKLHIPKHMSVSRKKALIHITKEAQRERNLNLNVKGTNYAKLFAI